MPRPTRREADRALLQALACGATVESAARKAGVSERTVYRRLDDPAFRKCLDGMRHEMVERTAALLTGAGLGAVKVLVDLQSDVSVSAGVRRRTARDVLELGAKLRESVDLEKRLAAVERRLAGTDAGDEESPATEWSDR